MDQPEKEVKFQFGGCELKGQDNPAMDLNESGDSGCEPRGRDNPTTDLSESGDSGCEPRGQDNPTMDLNESGDTAEMEHNKAPKPESHEMADIALIIEEEPPLVIGGKLEGEEKYVALRPPLHTFPSCIDDQKLREAAKAVFEEHYGCCSLARWKRRGIRKYYEQQVELLDNFENDRLEISVDAAVSIHDADADAKSRHKDAVVAKIVFFVNVCLLFTKSIASYLSGSLSVISTVLDSVMDLTSGTVVWMTMRAIKNSNPYRYPRGRTRLEPIAIIIVSIIMGIGNMLMIIESVSSIIQNTNDPRMGIPTVALVVGVIVVKAALYWLCARRHTSNSDVLAMDQRNDVVTNMVALIGALVGTYVWTYADPLGAISVCTYIAINWFRTAKGQVSLLSGKTAGADIINRIIKVGMDHDERIQCLDTAIAYHFGNDFLVEMHVVMDEETTTHREAHDVSEPLQYKLERLPYVERAFVHCDWEVGNDFELYQKNVRKQLT